MNLIICIWIFTYIYLRNRILNSRSILERSYKGFLRKTQRLLHHNHPPPFFHENSLFIHFFLTIVVREQTNLHRYPEKRKCLLSAFLGFHYALHSSAHDSSSWSETIFRPNKKTVLQQFSAVSTGSIHSRTGFPSCSSFGSRRKNAGRKFLSNKCTGQILRGSLCFPPSSFFIGAHETRQNDPSLRGKTAVARLHIWCWYCLSRDGSFLLSFSPFFPFFSPGKGKRPFGRIWFRIENFTGVSSRFLFL